MTTQNDRVKSHKPLVILVPGLGATGATYAPLLRRLRQRYTVRVAELDRTFPAKLTWSFFARPIDRAAGQDRRFILFGHSMGANTALDYAARHPDRVIRTVVVAPPVLPKEGIGVKGLARFRSYRRLQNLMLGLAGGRPGHALRAVRIRNAVLAGPRRRQLYDWINHRDLRSILPKLTNVTVLWGKGEEVLAREHLDELSRHPGIRTRIIKGSHNNVAIHPRPVLADILEALDG